MEKISIYVIVLFFIFTFGCSKKRTNVLVDEKVLNTTEVKKEIENMIYYIDSTTTTEISISWDKFDTALEQVKNYLPVDDEDFIKEFKEGFNQPGKKVQKTTYDIKYHVKIGSKSIFLDAWGYYVEDSLYKGVYPKFQLLLDYIKTHSNKSYRLYERPLVDSLSY